MALWKKSRKWVDFTNGLCVTSVLHPKDRRCDCHAPLSTNWGRWLFAEQRALRLRGCMGLRRWEKKTERGFGKGFHIPLVLRLSPLAGETSALEEKGRCWGRASFHAREAFWWGCVGGAPKRREAKGRPRRPQFTDKGRFSRFVHVGTRWLATSRLRREL